MIATDNVDQEEEDYPTDGIFLFFVCFELWGRRVVVSSAIFALLVIGSRGQR